MSCLIYHSKNYFAAFLATVLLYSLTYSVVAQDKAKGIDIPTYKVKLALSNLPTDKIKSISTIKYNFSETSLKISPHENHSLFLSYVSNENLPSYAKSTEISDTSGQSLAYISPVTRAPVIDKNAWDEQVRAKYKNGLILTVSPGIKHISIRRYTKAGPMFINVVEVNPALNPNIRIKPALAGATLPHTKRIQNIVMENDAVAGVNASFFKPSSGVPLGTLVINEELITGPIYERVTMGIKDNKFRMARFSLQGKIITAAGEEIKLDNVNQPRMLASYNIIYSDKWGKLAPVTPQYGMQIAVQDGNVVNISKDRLEIPANGYVIVGPEKELGKLKINDPVKITFSSDPDWSNIDHAISGGPYLVKDGQVYVDTKEQKFGSITGRNPRTAVGYTQDNKLIMVTVDGRQKGSVGATLYELARIMREFGCYNAMNLDGGSSTQMVVKGKIVNRPLSTGGNYVSNGLIVKLEN
ncbi:MAG: Exopolysaccharide biosynthesis protein [uncultured bacterium]|nr:MAG: Exopolysaccharide biosynthesis protein [uncultured bacterium]HBH17783.1 hypothetical protein [Cyanobacteria bacterium UBA9579]